MICQECNRGKVNIFRSSREVLASGPIKMESHIYTWPISTPRGNVSENLDKFIAGPFCKQCDKKEMVDIIKLNTEH